MVAKEIATWEPTDADLESISSIEDFVGLLKAQGETVGTANDLLAGGWKKVEKDRLVGVPFVIAKFKEMIDEKTSRPYVHVRVITQSGDKLWFNDGSTGIYAQLQKYYEETKKTFGPACGGGLTRSDYTFEDDKGETQSATTFYIDTNS